MDTAACNGGGRSRNYHNDLDSSALASARFAMLKSRPPADDQLESERPSKTRLKQQMHELQDLGHALAELPNDRLLALELPERLLDAIVEFKRTRSHEGRRRQLQYLGKLMRGVDPEPLRAAVDAFALGSAVDAMRLHEAERWRVELVRDDEAITRWAAAFPGSDVQRLRALVRAARRDEAAASGQRHGRGWRELFQFVKPHVERSEPP
jgi:ribosome-associated protein